jgi:hypothetical protein
MSTEVFPTSALHIADVFEKPLEGFEWRKGTRDPEGKRCQLLYRDGSCVAVHFGNGIYLYDRQYREDAVWFECYGMGIKLRHAEMSAFFNALGTLLDCDFVSEIGEWVNADEDGVWDEDLRDDAIRAMQRSPGSISRYFHKGDPTDKSENRKPYDPDAEMPDLPPDPPSCANCHHLAHEGRVCEVTWLDLVQPIACRCKTYKPEETKP